MAEWQTVWPCGEKRGGPSTIFYALWKLWGPMGRCPVHGKSCEGGADHA